MKPSTLIPELETSINIIPEFILRIVVCDSYLTKPIPGLDVIYSEFRGSDIKQVATSLDKALNIALKQATSNNQHVYKITLVKGLPFYGFHDKEHLFLKIFLYNPGLMKQAVELCSNGAILGQVLQPHESHLNFTLQFFIDFNLFGMSNIELQSVKFRTPINDLICSSEDPNETLNTFNVKRESTSYYEADCVASHILNRLLIGKGDGIENPGLEEVWNQEMERRKQLNMSIASNSLTQERLLNEGTDSHQKFKDMFLVKLANLIDKPPDSHDDVVQVHYPAETLDGSQFFNATDVNTHLTNSNFNVDLSKSACTMNDSDATIVNEDIALNSMDNEDLELVDMLQDLDGHVVDEDSVMGTPVVEDIEEEISNDEYSQILNEEIIHRQCDMDEKSPSWNDSFWEGANIPQLDAIKTYRKRKKRPLKLGLSRPKSKIKPIYDCKEPETVLSQLNNSDEINESRETIDCISNAHLRIKSELDLSKDVPFDISQKSQSLLKDDNIVNLVEKIDKSSSFSLNYEPKAGPSYISPEILTFDDEQSFASNEDEKAIESFYDQSNFFDLSMENSLRIETEPAQLVACNNNTNVADESTSSVPNNKGLSHHNKIWTPKYQAPSKDYVISTLDKYNIPKTKNQEPYYSNYKDVGDKIEIGQMILKLNSTLARDQKPYEKVLDTTSIEEWRQLLFLENNGFSQVDTSKTDSLKQILAGNRSCILQPLQKAPTTLDALKWYELNPRNLNIDDENIVDIKEVSAKPEDIENSQAIGLIDSEIDSSMSLDDKSNTEPDKTLQISMHTDGSFLCFGKNQSEKDLSVDFLTIMVAEVHTSVRSDLNPDPALDVIEAAFVTVANNCPDQNNRPKHLTIIIVVDNLSAPKYLDRCVFNKVVIYVKNENELIENIINLVKEHDPDIMCGYEIEMNSWGYILERAQIIGVEVVKEISRITEKHRQKKWRHDENEMEGRIIGRITFNVWRLFRYELALSSYSFENCMYVVLNERVPKYSYAQLANWWNDESRLFRWITVENYMTRLSGTFGAWRLRISEAKLKALAKNDLVNWSPVGIGFVKPSVRRGVLPALLRRILAARQAVKKGMKLQTDDALIANVTYGYTAANFSGRMPCVEVGDSVVAKGRETLERAIKLVRNGKWNAKVYQPCILQTKKRYVGYMYESPEQAKPVYEAKGIETVRRDGCPAGVKRVSWLVCAGPPGTPLVRLARSPPELTRDAALGPHVTYYATRALLPPLHRCLSLLGADVFKW
ncbi:unnamed protein product [Leptidea sinapis]|uniref:DNA polymerase zeta catalytic subunit n=1 Tax=Leptidea sinapis TaxID=189913 RepID=A0A5E4QKQ2_9NEOP|nr:unnamed protein product [Leptidea sinapis]